MNTETMAPDVDPLGYVRQRLREMAPSERPRLAVDVGTTQRTIYNIMDGERDAKYSTVMKLHKALKEIDAAAAVEASKS